MLREAILILASLMSIGRTLGRIGAGLGAVEGHTKHLVAGVPALNEGLTGVAAGLATTAGHLAAADAGLAGVMGEPVTRHEQVA